MRTWRTSAALVSACVAVVALADLGCHSRRPDSTGGAPPGSIVRRIHHRGRFYAEDAKRLAGEIDGYLRRASPPPLEGRLRGLVAPHAAYRFAGETLAHGYRLLQRARHIKRLIVLGVAHSGDPGIAVPQVSHYESIGGPVLVDRGAVASLAGSPPFRPVDEGYDNDHSIEVQLPFLRRVRPDVSIVPVLAGRLTPAQAQAAGEGLAQLLDARTAVLVSTDLTHRGKRYGFEVPRPPGSTLRGALRRLDFGAVASMDRLDAAGLARYRAARGWNPCGFDALVVALHALSRRPGPIRARALHYTTSAVQDGNWSRTISYLSLAFVSPATAPQAAPAPAR